MNAGPGLGLVKEEAADANEGAAGLQGSPEGAFFVWEGKALMLLMRRTRVCGAEAMDPRPHL